MKKEELYRRYLAGELGGDQLLSFEQRLSEEVDFREDFELYKEMEGFVEERVKKMDALEVLRGVSSEQKSRIKNPRNNVIVSNKLLWFLIIPSLVGMFVAWLASSKMQEIKNRELIMAEYKYPPNKGTRSLEVAGTKLDSAIHYFDLRRMAKSEQLFLEILAIDSLHQDANRYMGHISFLKGADNKSKYYCSKLDRLIYQDSILLKLLLE